MRLIGNELAKMHLADIIHGDLTTSNMMLRRPSLDNNEPELVRFFFFEFFCLMISSVTEIRF